MASGKKRFNIIDAVLILAILAICAGVFIRSGFADKISNRAANGELEYEFIVNSVKLTSEDYFKVGGKLYSQTTGDEVGEIVSFYTRPAEAYIELPTGEIVKTTIPDRMDVLGVAKVKGTRASDGRCMLDGTTHIAAGKNIYARTNEISFMFTVESVKYLATESDGN